MPEPVLQTDRAVAHLEIVLRHVIKVYYLTYAPSEIKAERCYCSRATFWRRVERGQLAVYRHILTRETVVRDYRCILEVTPA